MKNCMKILTNRLMKERNKNFEYFEYYQEHLNIYWVCGMDTKVDSTMNTLMMNNCVVLKRPNTDDIIISEL